MTNESVHLREQGATKGRKNSNLKSNKLTIAFVIGAYISLMASPTLFGQDSTPIPRVRGALESLRSQWRGDAARYELWNDALLLDEIDKQLEAEDEADPVALTKVISALVGAERKIDEAKLETLRDALAAWLESAPSTGELKIGDATGDALTPAEEDSGDGVEKNEPNTNNGMPEEGADKVADAAADLQEWLEAGGRNFSTWSDGLGLDSILSAAKSPKEATRQDVQNQLARVRLECDSLDGRSDYVRLRRALQAWQVAERYPIDEPLAAEARRRKNAFPGIDPKRLTNARNRLASKTLQLGSFLDSSDRYGANWKKYLEWEKLNDAFAGGIPLVAPLESVFTQFSSGEPGLRVQPFADVKRALNDYLALLRLSETRPERLVESRKDLKRSVAALNAWLGLASEKRQRLWREFLDLDALNKQLDESRPSVRRLQRVLKQFQADEEGLDHAKFTMVRRCLAKYIELLRVSGGPSATDIYTARVESIAQSIEKHILDPTNDTAAKLIRELRWLESTGLMPDLASKIKSLNAKPNFYAALHGDVITRLLQDRITDTQGINRMFEGSRVTGTADTIADVRAQLVPSRTGIILDVLLDGTTVTNSVAQQRRVFVRTQGTTSIHGGTRIFFGLDGVQATAASVSANTRQQVCNICINRRCTCGNRLIRRVASRRAEKTRPKAECTQTQEAEQTIRNRINNQTQQLVGRANSQMQQAFSRLNLPEKYLPELGLRSTNQKVLSQGRLTVGNYLAAVSDPPDVGAESDVAIQVHQSAINNVLADVFGGLRLDNDGLVELLKENNLPVPDELRNGPRKPAADEQESDDDNEEKTNPYWSITFDELQPATVTFTGGKIRISIRGRKFEQGDQQVNEPIEISANYRLRKNALRQLEAKRIGDLDVQFVRSPGRLSTRQLAYKTAIKKRMERLFQRRLSLDDLPAPNSNAQISRALGMLRSVLVDHVESTRGWLALALDLSNLDLKSQLGLSPSGSSTRSSNSASPAYSTQLVPASPSHCQTCRPTRRGIFRRRR